MPPRIRIRPRALCVRSAHPSATPLYITSTSSYASLATVSATTPAPPLSQTTRGVTPILHYPPNQPPSHKPPEVRKTQLHRQYQSLLKSSPIILIFQHNNVKAVEWMSIRREMAIALQNLDAERVKEGHEAIADKVKFQVIQSGIFASAMRVVEFYDPKKVTAGNSGEQPLTHGLSKRAHQIANNKKLKLDLQPLLSGPLAVVSFPTVSPQHLKAVLSILAPSAPDFPAPKRKANPDYYEPAVQNGLQKLMLLGARVEGKAFDVEGTKWVGAIPGGIDGLRAQLVNMLQGIGGSLTNALEGASRSLYFTVESRKLDMEEKEKGPEEKKE